MKDVKNAQPVIMQKIAVILVRGNCLIPDIKNINELKIKIEDSVYNTNEIVLNFKITN